ncbi:MAG: 50S ribosomal protein L9 [Zetaproteobacteria bacterium]|nr:50S ribosomal protein L9 [Zetaproteobacteria bacterium]
MRLILTAEVPSLGTIGDVVSVKPGYGRNFLLPRQMAVPANESNQRQLAHQKRVLATRREKFLAETRVVAKKIEGVTLTLAKQAGEDNRIFGSVTSAELAQLLTAQSVQVSKRDIVIPEEAKTLGAFVAKVKLHPEVEADLKFVIEAASEA